MTYELDEYKPLVKAYLKTYKHDFKNIFLNPTQQKYENEDTLIDKVVKLLKNIMKILK